MPLNDESNGDDEDSRSTTMIPITDIVKAIIDWFKRRKEQ
jgi:hypothetical protein